MINDAITRRCLEYGISSLEKYKYEVEGPNRTDGSYMLTFFKSALTASEKDPEAFRVLSDAFAKNIIIFVAGTAITVSIGTAAYFKFKEYKNKAKEKENTK